MKELIKNTILLIIAILLVTVVAKYQERQRIGYGMNIEGITIEEHMELQQQYENFNERRN